MAKDVILLKNPGFVYDLIYSFALLFNRQKFLHQALQRNMEKEYTEFAAHCEALFGEIPEDLYLFFTAPKDPCFLTQSYFRAYRNRFPTDYSLELMLEELADVREVSCRLVKHYFPVLSRATVEELLDSQPKLFALIKESAYSDYHKARLYEFFGDPSYYVSLLIASLRERGAILQAYYDEHYEEALAEAGPLDRETLREHFSYLDEARDAFERERITPYVSLCAFSKMHASIYSLAGGFIMLVGSQYTAHRPNKRVKLDRFSLVVGDDSRVRILDFIREKGEITCKDLEHNFNFSGSTAYHHLTVMTRAGAIATRHEGKTILYSLNKPYFAAVAESVAKYSE